MSRPFRLPAFEYVGIRRYFLTICTHRRRREFDDADRVALVWAQFLHIAQAEHFAFIVYCFMPDHVHAVVVAQSPTADLPRFVRLAKQRSGFSFAQAAGRRLWQGSYFDRSVRDDESLPGLVLYIIENPVRAGLVGAATDHPYWGSQIYSRDELLEFVSRERQL
jgi:REP element-mobilizing transposase RayT